MNPFKAGHKVIAVSATSSGVLTLGAQYTVASTDGNLVIIEGLYANGERPKLGVDWKYFIPAPPVCSAMLLPSDSSVRKGIPITTGVLDYFPLALAAVAQCSKAGNDQHNPGQPLRWAKEKSTDHADCISRHLIDRNTYDTDGVRHAAKLAWRALALLETILEAERAAVTDKA